MARFSRAMRSRKLGFTLVELLVVVSIIGVLATVGIPTFRTMVQKSKKSEAKVALGGLYTAEQAFFSEYNTYGNVLTRVGFDLDAGGGLTYTVGFPEDGDCTDADTANVKPALANNVGNALNRVFPTYFNSTALDALAPANGGPGLSIYKASVYSSKCAFVSKIPDDGLTFTATATGKIAPGKTGGVIEDYDQWTIDQSRTLANSYDGVFK